MFKNILKINYSPVFLIFFNILNLLLIGFVNPAMAEETSEKQNANSSERQNENANSNYGLPIHRRDGGSRNGNNSCIANTDRSNLVALIPDEIVGASASASPELFFYIPEVKDTKILEFVLRNQEDEMIYETFLTTAGKGIVSVKIPAELNLNKLGKEQKYHWYLSMICNPQERSKDIVVEGWMEQSSLDLATKEQLNFADSLARANIYHQKGFWYDALATVVSEEDLINKEPDFKVKWSELLDSVGLAELSSASFIETKMINIANIPVYSD